MQRRSLLTPSLAVAAPLVVVDLVARMMVPAAMLAAVHGEPIVAATVASGVSVLAVLRGILNGWSVERELEGTWSDVLHATTRRSVTSLRARPAAQSVPILLDAVQQVATLRAVAVPKLVTDLLGLAIVTCLVVARLGMWWLAIGVGLATLMASGLFVARRRLLEIEARGHASLAELGYDLMTLIEGAPELRAHNRQQWLLGEMNDGVRRVAASQRRANRYSALIGLLPVGLALLAAMVSQHLLPEGLGSGQAMAEVAIFGGTGLVLGMGAVRALETIARSAPQCEAYRAFMAGAHDRPAPGGGALPSWDEPIIFEDVGVRYGDASPWTPSPFNLEWPVGQSLVVAGDNGAGKTTLALVLLRLIAPTRGCVTLGDIPFDAIDADAFGEAVTYLPQSPLVIEGRSLAWHLRLSAGEHVSDADLEEALESVGLASALRARSDGTTRDVLSLELGTLSGGERQRLLLARLVLPRPGGFPKLVVVDEPEVGLDAEGRRLLRSLLERLATRSRVLLIAHDGSVAPETFRRVECNRGSNPPSGAPSLPA